uniref:Lipase-like PAD4 n=2 Tax=Kalanchoe fedtschenkoi TaxID=63787 RepID=A0A7N0TWN7_KALFE
MGFQPSSSSQFEASEMVASAIASAPILAECWSHCARVKSAGWTFVVDQSGPTSYVAFSSSNALGSHRLVRIDSVRSGVFEPLMECCGNEDEPVMVHEGMLGLFFNLYYDDPLFRNQMTAILSENKPIIFTGHSLGGAGIAALAALWLLSHLQSISSCLPVLCVTFGSPLMANRALSRAILRERWGGSFCHVVSKNDILPRLFLAPVVPPHLLDSLLHFWHFSTRAPGWIREEEKVELFRFVTKHTELAAIPESKAGNVFWPFGNYVFCCDEGAICVDNGRAVLMMLHALFTTSSPLSCIEDHMNYGHYIRKMASQAIYNRDTLAGAATDEISECSYDAGLKFTMQSSGLTGQESVVESVKDCLIVARRVGRTPNLNSADLAIKLAGQTPRRAEIEWYKALCDQSGDQLGYYDSFKRRSVSKRETRVNINRLMLAGFWDNVIRMLDENQLPHDFEKRAKWVNASQFYKLLVEPLDIAEYYRSGKHKSEGGGHYVKHGRPRRYLIFDKWWRRRTVNEKDTQNERTKFASLTQDTCFWANVEEAREWLDCILTENDSRKLDILWQKLIGFENYAARLIESKLVSKDVVAKNSSYIIWAADWIKFKSQFTQTHPQGQLP